MAKATLAVQGDVLSIAFPLRARQRDSMRPLLVKQKVVVFTLQAPFMLFVEVAREGPRGTPSPEADATGDDSGRRYQQACRDSARSLMSGSSPHSWERSQDSAFVGRHVAANNAANLKTACPSDVHVTVQQPNFGNDVQAQQPMRAASRADDEDVAGQHSGDVVVEDKAQPTTTRNANASPLPMSVSPSAPERTSASADKGLGLLSPTAAHQLESAAPCSHSLDHHLSADSLYSGSQATPSCDGAPPSSEVATSSISPHGNGHAAADEAEHVKQADREHATHAASPPGSMPAPVAPAHQPPGSPAHQHGAAASSAAGEVSDSDRAQRLEVLRPRPISVADPLDAGHQSPALSPPVALEPWSGAGASCTAPTAAVSSDKPAPARHDSASATKSAWTSGPNWSLSKKQIAQMMQQAGNSVPQHRLVTSFDERMDNALHSLRGEAPLVRLRIKVLPEGSKPAAAAAPAAEEGRKQAAAAGGISLPSPAVASQTLTGWLMQRLGFCKNVQTRVFYPDVPAPCKVPPVASKLVSVNFELAGGLDLSIKSPYRKSRRIPSHEALDSIIGQYNVHRIPPPLETTVPVLREHDDGAASRRLPDCRPLNSGGCDGGAGRGALAPSSTSGTASLPATGNRAASVKEDGPQDRRHHEAVSVYGERWAERVKRVQRESPHGGLPGWHLRCVIVKSGDDCRQELLAVQLIRTFESIFRDSGLPLWVRFYEVRARPCILQSEATSARVVLNHDVGMPCKHVNRALHQAQHLAYAIHLHFTWPDNLHFVQNLPAFFFLNPNPRL